MPTLTSTTTPIARYWLPSDTETLARLDTRVERLTRVPQSHQEQAKVLRYQPGEHFGLHADHWDPRHGSMDPTLMARIHGGYRNRFVTALLYFTDGGAENGGGETAFPFADVSGQKEAAGAAALVSREQETTNTTSALQKSFSEWCSKGLRVVPKRGRAVLLYSLLPDGTGDADSRHCSCPLRRGATGTGVVEKWAANRFIWNVPRSTLTGTPRPNE